MQEKKVRAHRVTAADGVVLACSLAAAAASFLLVPRGSTAQRTLVIQSRAGEEVYPLSSDAVYQVEGPLGKTTITVSGGTAFFSDSPCPNKTCVQSMPLSRGGDWAACLPNEVFLRIEGPDGAQTDATAL